MTPGSATEWYYVGHYGQLGPLTLEQIQELVQDGVVAPETFVWRTGMSGWQRADSTAEIVPLMRGHSGPPPPPLPTASPQTPAYMSSGYLALPKSDRDRTLAGLLQLLIPGTGRMYLGYAAHGVLQLVLTPCIIGWVWSMVDGVLILAGSLRLDGYGRVLTDK